MIESLLPRKTKVLVIDDDAIVLEVVRERLELAGYEVTTRETSLGTLQLVRELQPDVVLLDVIMPALNGERLATLLKSNERTKDVWIILHSSKSEAELASMMKDTGAIGAISKSENEGNFIERFDALLKQRARLLRQSERGQ